MPTKLMPCVDDNGVHDCKSPNNVKITYADNADKIHAVTGGYVQCGGCRDSSTILYYCAFLTPTPVYTIQDARF